MVHADSETADLLLRGGTVVTMDAARTVYERGYVAVRGAQIKSVGPDGPAAPRAREERDVTGHVVLPGLVNCHTHLSNGISRGLFDELPLADWVEKGMWPSLRANTREATYHGARVALAENLLGGVTTTVVGEFGVPARDTLDGVLSAITEAGSRSVVARISVDSADDHDPSQAVPPDVREDIDSALAEVDRLRATHGSSLLEVVPEALGVLRCSADMVTEFARYAREQRTRMTMHVASSPDERDEAQHRFGKGSVERLYDLGVLGPHLLVAHCVWNDSLEPELLAESETGVSHNPVANLMYASGLAPLSEMLEAGVRVGLGTDGASTNNGQNMWEVMKAAVFLQKSRFGAGWSSAELALELATLGGARAIGMDDRIGSLEPGKRADLVVVSLDRPELVPHTTWPSNLVYSSAPSAVRTVFVDGRAVVDDARVVAWELEEIIAHGNRMAREMDAHTGLAKAYRERSGWRWIAAETGS